jgi:pectate lyase
MLIACRRPDLFSLSAVSRLALPALLAALAAAAGCGKGATENTGTGSGGGQGSGAGGSTGAGGSSPTTGGGGANGTGGMVTTGSGGAGGGSTCATTTPPPAGTLVGWAAANTMNPNGTTGGGDVAPVTVSTVADFNSNAAGTAAKVIYVTGSLMGQFTVGSNKTIVGLCGAQLQGHVSMDRSTNVIFRNLTVVGYGVGDCRLDPMFDPTVGCSSGQDAISLNTATRVWLDHLDVSDGTDGNVDITLGSDFVTVSWTKFHYTPRTDNGGSDSTGASGHRYSNLVGGSDNSMIDVGKLDITWHHNWWADNAVERMPRVRYGQNHVFNNLYTAAHDDYCVRAGMDAQLLVENNAFIGVGNPQQFNSTADQGTSFITANNNLYTNTSGSRATGGGGTAFTMAPYTYTLDDASTVQAAVMAGAGPQ